MPSWTYTLHVLRDFEGYTAGEVIDDPATIAALHLGPHHEALSLRRDYHDSVTGERTGSPAPV